MDFSNKLQQFYIDAGVDINDANVKEVLEKVTALKIELKGDALSALNKFATVESIRSDAAFRGAMRAEALDGIDKHLEGKVSGILTSEELSNWKRDNGKSQQKIDSAINLILERALKSKETVKNEEVEKNSIQMSEANKDLQAQINGLKNQLDIQNAEREKLDVLLKRSTVELETNAKNKLYNEYLAAYEFTTPRGREYVKADIESFIDSCGGVLVKRGGELMLVSKENADVQIRDKNNMPIVFTNVAETIIRDSKLLKVKETVSQMPSSIPNNVKNNSNLVNAQLLRAQLQGGKI